VIAGLAQIAQKKGLKGYSTLLRSAKNGGKRPPILYQSTHGLADFCSS
jgi:hypothetical protein